MRPRSTSRDCHFQPTTAARPAADRLAADRQRGLAVPARVSAAGLHGHRLRRLGPHLRRNGRRRASRAARHRPLGVGLRAVRLGHALGRSCWRFRTWTRPRAQGRECVPLDRRARSCRTRLWIVLAVGIVVAQFLCGLATVTSASRMAYAFARDGGLPFSDRFGSVSPKFRTPAVAIWTVSLLSVAFVRSHRTRIRRSPAPARSSVHLLRHSHGARAVRLRPHVDHDGAVAPERPRSIAPWPCCRSSAAD